MNSLLKIGLGLLITITAVSVKGQDKDTEIQIHQINVGNGDGALILLYDKKVLVYTIVIDGGLVSDGNKFVPYLKKYIPDMPKKPGIKQVDWVILSHNHQDHFKGLVEMFNDKAFIVGEITDQGGYTIGENDFKPLPPSTAKNTNSVPYITLDPKKPTPTPQASLTNYVQAVKTASDRSKLTIGHPITRETPFDTAAGGTTTFKTVTLPDVGGVPVKMICIAANGYTAGSSPTRNIGKPADKPNANNFTFGWILEYGEFRYYTGGDLGGTTKGYTDQETPMADYIKTLYPNNFPLTGTKLTTDYPGHICAMKTNHHGSTQSSNTYFLKTLACSAIVTSAGKHSSWKIPTTTFIDRLALAPIFGLQRGVYFTQIYNYTIKNQARARANTKFKANVNYDYVDPSDDETKQYSYLFIVKPTAQYIPTPPGPAQTIKITEKSLFSVYKVAGDHTQTSQKVFLCHKSS